MNSGENWQYLSFILRLERGHFDGQFNGEIVMADGRRLNMADGTYKVRAWVSADRRVTRGQITQTQTNVSVHFQTGDRIAKFIDSIINKPDSIGRRTT